MAGSRRSQSGAQNRGICSNVPWIAPLNAQRIHGQDEGRWERKKTAGVWERSTASQGRRRKKRKKKAPRAVVRMIIEWGWIRDSSRH